MPFSETGGGTPTKIVETETRTTEEDNTGHALIHLESPTFSPDGQKIAYTKLFLDQQMYACCGDEAEVNSIPAAGGDPTNIFPRTSSDTPEYIAWAPKTPDTTKPTSNAIALPRANSAGWNTSDVTVTLFAQDPFPGSGVEKITYSATGAQSIAETAYDPNSKPVIKNDGTTTISYYATDKAGNVQDPKSLTIKIDKTNPVTTLEAVTEDGGYESGTPTNKDVTLNLSATDESGSGVGSITYEVTNGGQDLASKTVSGDTVSIPVTTEGENLITYYATDKVGRKEAAQTFTVALDKTAPSVSSNTPNNGDTAVSRSTTVTATFTEAMDPQTLTSTSVQLFSGDSKTPLKESQVSVSADGKSVTLIPSKALSSKMKYTAKIRGGTNGAKDIAGNPLAEDYAWYFTTGTS